MKFYCINTSHRTDRRERMVQEFTKHGLDYEFFDAITPDCGGIQFKNKYEKGCYLSHLALLESTPDMSVICEDDVIFSDNIGQKIGSYLDLLPKIWLIAYLGVCGLSFDYLTKEGDILRAKNQWGAIAYIINPTHRDFIVSYVKSYPTMIDRIYRLLQNSYPCYVSNPFLAYTYDSYSDIRGGYFEYENLLDKKF